MEWSWFKKPVKVEQINNDYFSDTVPSKKKKKNVVNEVMINDYEYDYTIK